MRRICLVFLAFGVFVSYAETPLSVPTPTVAASGRQLNSRQEDCNKIYYECVDACAQCPDPDLGNQLNACDPCRTRCGEALVSCPR